MSSARDRSRSIDGRKRLVLVRGGRDDRRPSADDADWQAFCERIGWQEDPSSPPDELEKLLVERIVSTMIREGFTDVENDERATHVASAEWCPPVVVGTPVKRWRDRRVAWAKASFTAAAAMAVASVVLIVAATMLSWADHRSAAAASSAPPYAATVVEPAKERAASHRTTKRDPQSVDAPDRTEAAPDADREVGDDDAAPSGLTPNRPDEEPAAPVVDPPRCLHEPGMRVASRSKSRGSHGASSSRVRRDSHAGAAVARRASAGRSRDQAEERSVAMARAMETRTVGAVSFEHSSPTPEARQMSLERLELERPSGGASFASAVATFAPRSLEPDAGTSVWTASAKAASSGASTSNASWSIPQSGQRWYGVGLTPSREPVSSSGMGVMAQVDLGRALGQL